MNNEYTCVNVDPGVCGFPFSVRVQKKEKRTVQIDILNSGCKHIQKLAESLKSMTLNEVFMPITQNPVFLSAQNAGCHPSCPVTVSIIKAVEVALGIALPRDVQICFETPK